MQTTLKVDNAGKRYYRPELDVLRFGAFMLVFFDHTIPIEGSFWSNTPVPGAIASAIVAFSRGGAFGVDLFFALSSFLICTLLLMERDKTGTVDVPAYYMRRILRIWPLYFFFLLIAAPLMHFVIPAENMPLKYTAAFLLLAGNWACVLWGYPISVASPLWSVSMEEQFYLACPWVLKRWAHRLLTIGAVMIGVSFVARFILVWHGAVHPQIWANTLARFDPIAAGAMLAVIVHRKEIVLNGLQRAALIVFGLGMITVLGRVGDVAGVKSLFTLPLGAIAVMALIVAMLGIRLPPASNPVVRALIYLGRISYGLYVFHYTFVMLFNVNGTHAPAERMLRIGATLVCTIAVAAVSYRFLEQPFLRLKERFAKVRSRPVTQDDAALPVADLAKSTQAS